MSSPAQKSVFAPQEEEAIKKTTVPAISLPKKLREKNLRVRELGKRNKPAVARTQNPYKKIETDDLPPDQIGPQSRRNYLSFEMVCALALIVILTGSASWKLLRIRGEHSLSKHSAASRTNTAGNPAGSRHPQYPQYPILAEHLNSENRGFSSDEKNAAKTLEMFSDAALALHFFSRKGSYKMPIKSFSQSICLKSDSKTAFLLNIRPPNDAILHERDLEEFLKWTWFASVKASAHFDPEKQKQVILGIFINDKLNDCMSGQHSNDYHPVDIDKNGFSRDLVDWGASES